MDFNATIEIIIKDLREIRSIIDDFKNYSGVPLLQVELAKAKCKSAEEIISLLKILKQGFESVPQKKIEKRRNEEEPLIVISDEEPVAEGEVPEEPKSVSEEKKGTGQQTLWQEKDRANKLPENLKGKKTETPIFADQFSRKQPTVLDQFGDEKDNGISEIIKSQPINDIAEAIGINDKFLFIREIFGGDRNSYEEAIIKLNHASSYRDAKAILNSYTSEGEENEVVRQLLDIVKRKLPADE
ncbi:MAG: hypothetical protein ACUVTX_00020 [Bacteroidales bacterium]